MQKNCHIVTRPERRKTDMCTNDVSDCKTCQKEYEMPNYYCCLPECGEHEWCRGCDKGIYLKKE